ncbi:YcaO-like family protein [Sulfidibacter corallicola]|uniref:YcaO-like family protein n=1 Tax=Sulfidibacter corallicola TaxID=2818388 RepID=A0A8A4TTM3_SULCO|nr:YcaO-like family protein [Sulfidibacter corallicola]QTD52494.1 YcaO-like family protein [Sulfidibacter corallicola]
MPPTRENPTPVAASEIQRSRKPEETLRWISPHLKAVGITRVADLTRLDSWLGFHVFCAVRPRGVLLQSTTGKGTTAPAATVSALMEATEQFHAESADHRRFRKPNSIPRGAARWRSPASGKGPRFMAGSAEREIHPWVAGENLHDGERLWLPASLAWFLEPTLVRTHTNGLAAGNDRPEATLHGLYELLERDAVSRLTDGYRIHFGDRCRAIDPTTIETPWLATIRDAIREAEVKLILLRVQSIVPVHTCWAVLLDRRPHHRVTAFQAGYGTHTSLEVAAARAIGEAVQARLTAIHGARDDLPDQAVFSDRDAAWKGPAYRFFEALRPDIDWHQATRLSTGPDSHSSDRVLAWMLDALAAAGHDKIYRIELTRPEIGVPVVKMIAPSLRYRRSLF